MDGNGKDSKQKIKNKSKPRNPNLRLVKNGDMPQKGSKTAEKPPQPGAGKFRTQEKSALEDGSFAKKGRKKPKEEIKKPVKNKKQAGELPEKESGQSEEGKRPQAKNRKQTREGKKTRTKGKKAHPGGKELQDKEKKGQEEEKELPDKGKGKQGEGKESPEKGKGKQGEGKGLPDKGKGGHGEGKESPDKGKGKQGEGKELQDKGKERAEGGKEEQELQEKEKQAEAEEPQTKEKKQEKKGESQKSKNAKKGGKGKKQPTKAGKPSLKGKKTAEKTKKSKVPTIKKPKSGRRKREREYQDKLDIGDWLIQNKSLMIIGLTAAAIVCVLVGIYRYIITAYEVTTVYVDGNVHYTNEEVMDMVMGGRYGNNSLYLAAKYKDKGIEGVPFVEKMDVNILSPDTIRISVYEKALAGYVEYLGRYMYFDRDGIVVESSQESTSSIPQVTGLKFDYIVLNDYLPVENDEIFKRILDITQLLNKYELMADKIYFNSTYELTLFFDDIRVTLGSDSDIDQKIIHLKNILPNLEGKKGTLRMESYTEDTKNITFLQE
jgi:cell division protein FtsQ